MSVIDRRRFLERGTLTLAGLAVAPRVLAEQAKTLVVHSEANFSTPIQWFDRLLTPNEVFFVRSHFGPPAIDPKRRLAITGLVDRPFDLGMNELAKLPEVTVTAVLQCAGNGRAEHRPRVPGVQWVHGAMGQATWTGVRLKDVLAKAGIKKNATHVQVRGADLPPKPTVPAFIRGVPLDRALLDDVILAHRMNGVPLPHEHGAPFRLVVPGWSGAHWVKWLSEVKVIEGDPEGFFYRTAYRLPIEPATPGVPVPPEKTKPVSSFPVKSIIATPVDGTRAKAGPQEIVGVAFSGEEAIEKVEVSVDGGKTWNVAGLEGDRGMGRWNVFRFRFEAKRGRHTALSRATDRKGFVQPKEAQWNPSGYWWNAWHSVSWEVA